MLTLCLPAKQIIHFRNDTEKKMFELLCSFLGFFCLLHLSTCLTGRVYDQELRRISCNGRKHSQASCEYSLTIFLCCQHHSEYSLLGSKFSTNLLFAANKCHVTIKTTWQFEMFKMAEPDGIVAVVKHCWLLLQGRRGCREKSLNTTAG